MGKYFGTDGIRGEANKTLTLDIALKVGQYLGSQYKGKKLLVGQDTRLSGNMFASAIASGASSMGAHVYMLGVCSTPAVSYLVVEKEFAGAVMISASHNPYQDNGLKCFAASGMKISDDMQDDIEAFIDGEIELEFADSESIGRINDYAHGMENYISFIESVVQTPLKGLKIVLDNANGSAVSSSQKAFEDLGAQVHVMHSEPNGVNINYHCGSTHPESLMEKVKELKYDMGFAFDGDADRCLAVDHEGNLVDGDAILYILAQDLEARGLLNQSTIVSTVMANIGFIKAAKAKGFNVVQTDVGDKHVFAEMVEKDYALGGEQSGHIIVKRYMNTGDGVLTALMIAEIVAKANDSLQSLLDGMLIFPQVLHNMSVEDKHLIMGHESVLEAERNINEALEGDGRILIRASGTENLIRIMVEAQTHELCEGHISDMIKVIRNIG
ncbi:MAG TPA: phosphoglucosamine mutase [Erysipelothrix sp.]|nr:phosphoglucosamine mutase [Erysipelothrix sp.]